MRSKAASKSGLTVLTGQTTTVDASPRAVMWSISQVAERDGVSKQAISKAVGRLVESHGLAVERDTAGRIRAINVAGYDAIRGRYGDPSKAQAPARAPHTTVATDGESYDEALRQKTWYDAEKRRLELEVVKGNLVEVGQVTSALTRVAEEINRMIDRLPNISDDIAAAIAREGVHGGRVILRQHAVKLRGEIAAALRDMAVSQDAGSGDP